MPNIRKPTEVHELTGAYQHDPKRRRPPAPKSRHPLGEPPKAFTAEEKTIWGELQHYTAPGVLTGAERHAVETYCVLMGKFRQRAINSAELASLIKLISLFGGTPVDRTRLMALPDQNKADSPYSEFQ